MRPVDILVNARIAEAQAKGIGPGGKMIARMLGSETDNDDECYHEFRGGQITVKADYYSSAVSITAGGKTLFKQDADGKVDLFVPEKSLSSSECACAWI